MCSVNTYGLSTPLRQLEMLLNSSKLHRIGDFLKNCDHPMSFKAYQIVIFDERHVPPTQLGDGPRFFRFFCDAFPKGLRRFLDMLELQPIWNISHKQILYYSIENALSYNTKVK